ncbi:hypothetical protein IE990_28210 [Klebsiella pneumoniae]|uniref:Uncharacterized protein n=1 Tax=Klebsiella pneumoniae TaxID=573 RepID=A0A927DIG9_KLEPN|nr:hypothetical protein [Klebsiella pneumoniae]
MAAFTAASYNSSLAIFSSPPQSRVTVLKVSGSGSLRDFNWQDKYSFPIGTEAYVPVLPAGIRNVGCTDNAKENEKNPFFSG